MKRYIKSAVAENITLKEWVIRNQGIIPPHTKIVIADFQSCSNDPDDCPGVLFDDIFQNLAQGKPQNNYFIYMFDDEDYTLEDFLNLLDNYIIDEIHTYDNSDMELIVYNQF